MTKPHLRELLLLEDRLAPANLTLTDVMLTDAFDVPQSTPVFGQKLYLRAEYSATGMTAQNVPLRFDVNSMPLQPGVAIAAGNSSGTALANGWFAGTSAITVTVTLDPENTVVETNESDNTFTFTITPTAPTDLPSKFIVPMGRTYNVDWNNTHYADVDPRPGIAVDAQGGSVTYDGHDGTDSSPFGNDGMDAGFPIYAAADGVVQFHSEGNADRDLYGSGNINWLYINHGNGWATFYGHLAQNSQTVRDGDTVKAGQVIAMMGASGTFNAHLHYQAEYRGAVIEPLFAPTSYWKETPPPYAANLSTTVIDAYITNRDPYPDPIWRDLYEHSPRVERFAPGDASTLWFMVLNHNARTPAHATTLGWKWYRPDGSLWNTFPAEFTPSFDAGYFYWSWNQPASAFTGTPGVWQCAFLQDGVEVKRIDFTVAAAGDPSLRLSAPLPVIANDPSGTTEPRIVIDERSTPIEIVGSKVFTIENLGSSPLVLGNYTLPSGFALVGSPPTSVAAHSTTTFTLQLSGTPGSKFGTMSFTTNDPDVPVMSFNLRGTIAGSPAVGSPVINFPDAALGYNFKSLPRVFAPNATLTDSDSANFNTGSLVVDLASGVVANDRLSIRHQGSGPGQIGLTGVSTLFVTYGGISIGTVSGGIGNSLSIALNANATPAAVQALIRNLTYANVDTQPSYQRRDLRLTLIDDTGKVSNQAIATVSPSGVERAPSISPIANGTIVTNQSFSKPGSFADAAGNAWTATVNYGDGAGPQSLALNLDRTFMLTRSYASVGAKTVTVTITSDTGGVTSTSFTMTAVLPPTTVNSFTVNGGAAQRSRLTTIRVNFPAPVEAAQFANPGAITLTRGAIVVQTGAIGPHGRILVSPASGLVSSVTLTFDNADGSAISPGVEYGSLADGQWRLAVPAAGYQSSASDPLLRRLFGDFNGDSTVDGATDFAAFGSVFGTTLTASPFDFNADGTIDGAADFAAFGANFGRTVS